MTTSHLYPRPHAQTAGRLIDGEAVLILADDSEIKVLNAVGSRIYELADGTRSVAEIGSTISEEYDIEQPEAESDVLAFLEELVRQRVFVMTTEQEQGAT